MDNKQIGNRIKTRRKELGYTLGEVANTVGVASSTIMRYENGIISQYKLPVLESIANALKVNPTWFVKEDATMEIITIPESITSIQEKKLIANFNLLNEIGKYEAIKRVNELTEINKYTIYTYGNDENAATLKVAEPLGEYLVNAAHDKEGTFTEDDRQHDDNIMCDDNLWKS